MEKNKEKGIGETKEREGERDKERDKDDARSVCSIKTSNMLNVSSQPTLRRCVNHLLHLIILIFKTAYPLKFLYFMHSLFSATVLSPFYPILY